MYRAVQICSSIDPICSGLRRGAIEFGALFVDLRQNLGKYVWPLGVSRSSDDHACSAVRKRGVTFLNTGSFTHEQ